MSLTQKILCGIGVVIVSITLITVVVYNTVRIAGFSDAFVTEEEHEEHSVFVTKEECNAFVTKTDNNELWAKQQELNAGEAGRTQAHILAQMKALIAANSTEPAGRRPFKPARPTRDRSRPAGARPSTTPLAPSVVGLTEEQLAMLQEASDNTIRLNAHENRIAALERHEGPLNPRYANKAEFVTLSEGFARIQSTLCEIKESLATTTPTAPTTTEK